MADKSIKQPLSGTREWSRHSANIQEGCENGCRYCYARYNAVIWLKKCSPARWKEPVIYQAAVDKEYQTREGVTMFPTTHDITLRNISECLCVIKKLLDAGNRILIVSKPRWSCIPVICESIKSNFPNFWQNRVTFRFTIGSPSDAVLKFWEPGAPGFAERLACLKYAFEAGFETSVSAEPYLDGYVDHLYFALIDWITESFWIGLLNKFNQRVDLSKITKAQMHLYVKPLMAAQSEQSVRALYEMMKDRPKVMWKDSIRKVLGL